ncbi:hypothetical protein [Chondrinema litorale]|uniref:hypothetical protein n=1 Tax=Chondrinema litorale TaxID=2994555 RepID=UPI002543F433|nr:hypothetical protein [Chondrinema litorale]UZR96095.1 hypothetical protein OQ292_09780 [Chondrinema litorale]
MIKLKFNKYSATIIGAIIAIICFVSTSTFFIPALTIIPLGLTLELSISTLLGNSNYALTSFLIAVILFSLFILLFVLYIKKNKKDIRDKKGFSIDSLLFFFTIQLVILHPMIFYFWAMANASNSGDGQFIFGIVETFPVSSVCFVVLGILIDFVKNMDFSAE